MMIDMQLLQQLREFWDSIQFFGSQHSHQVLKVVNGGDEV